MDCDLIDMPSCHTEKTVKARGEHTCCECRGSIKVGEIYQRVTGIWEGQPASYATCQDCVHLRCEVTKFDSGGCGFIYGGLREELADMNGEDGNRLRAAYNAVAPIRGGRLIK